MNEQRPSVGPVRLVDGDWQTAFRRLNESGGGVISVPAGVHQSEPTTVDVADYPNLGDDVSIRGAGLGASVVDLGTGGGDGLSIVDGDGSDRFYLEVSGVQFRGEREGVLFRLGRDDYEDAFNSCTLSFATNNGHPEGTAACRFNHVLNSRHFGVHNAAGETALQLRRVQFGGITGSVRCNRGVSMELTGYTFANVIEWLNVEACHDGVRIVGEKPNINRFGMLYGANLDGTLWRHDAPGKTRIDAAFVGDSVATVDERTAGRYTVGLSNASFASAGAAGERAAGD
jgi:hypothetical protein